MWLRALKPRGLGRRLFHLGLILLLVLPFLWILLHLVAPAFITPLMVQRLTEGHGWSQRWRPLVEISPHLQRAVIAAEDNRFCQHLGIDWGAIKDAREEVERGRRSQSRGASTISQQTAKNLLLWPQQSRTRKALELTYVTWLEALWPKQRILEIYLNIVEMGPGIYGAEAAAQAHFGVSAKDLSRRQAALLATTLPNPLARNPAKPSGNHASRARRIEQRMRNLEGLVGCLPGES